MPLLDITDPKIIRFLAESYEKESRLRMRWVQRNSKDIEKCATFKSDVKNYKETDITKATIIAGINATIRDHAISMQHRLRIPVPDYLSAKTVIKPSEPSSNRIMLPVKDEVKHILLESRNEYLKTRAREAPGDKYYFMESTNWKYGWKLNESEMKMRGPMHGRVYHTMQNLKCRVGPQPDPQHYSSPYVYSHPCFKKML
ncbi:hypothetical protein O3G_MSEX003601 [Manduca sexta]|uniref:Sperm microtubule inner protein 1 C-terminal domain-containing protein n=1 Tax=Manduca sexta TaxID=7130 RepID=A0A922CGE1_MANSE|nr:hypothetical protein O3G_MSEX003601 [Manduca sexta]